MRGPFYKPACLVALVLAACHPLREPQLPTEQSVRAPLETTPPSVPDPASAPPLPESALSAPKISSKTISGISFEGVTYDSRSHHLLVVDQPGGPGSRYDSAQTLAGKSGALLAINAGFFTPEGEPLGLVISKGKTSGGWNSSSSLGSGIYLESSSGSTTIRRRGTRSSVSGSRELLQAGPLLVERGNAVAGLESTKTALRSVILTDGGTRWWIGKTSSCTLFQLASALSNNSPAPWKTATALNLDGGRSTDLHISAKLPGGPINRRSFLNRPVRNFLILVPR